MSDEPERELLVRFVHGDRDAFAVLFRRFEPEVHRWIARIVRDAAAADDAVVETFWRAYRSRARFDPDRPLGAWLRRIATRAALDRLKESRAAVCCWRGLRGLVRRLARRAAAAAADARRLRAGARALDVFSIQ
jgi:DNA-directed RNA polymerase specialized sigma24 family protein